MISLRCCRSLLRLCLCLGSRSCCIRCRLRLGQPHLRHPHGAGLVHGVHAAASALGHLRCRKADAAVPGALHAVEIAVGGGGVGHTVVQSVGRPAGKILRQRVGLTVLFKEINALFLAGDKLTAQPPGAVGCNVADRKSVV